MVGYPGPFSQLPLAKDQQRFSVKAQVVSILGYAESVLHKSLCKRWNLAVQWKVVAEDAQMVGWIQPQAAVFW